MSLTPEMKARKDAARRKKIRSLLAIGTPKSLRKAARLKHKQAALDASAKKKKRKAHRADPVPEAWLRKRRIKAALKRQRRAEKRRLRREKQAATVTAAPLTAPEEMLPAPHGPGCQ